MAVKYMTSVNIAHYGNLKDMKGWEYAETLVYVDTELTSDPVIIPDSIKEVSVGLIIGTGTGKVQTSTSPLANVVAGTANWIDWDNGTVSSSTQDICYPVTAIRFICSTGTVKLEMRGQ